ncbi:MAG: Lrp/AsnC ligand binding domain-containing protein [Candidatus Geothermarchaeales archaeon]
MVSACVLICCRSGRFTDVVNRVKKMRGVRKAFHTLGRWDVAVEVETADIKALGKLALRIHKLSGVRASETLVGF